MKELNIMMQDSRINRYPAINDRRVDSFLNNYNYHVPLSLRQLWKTSNGMDIAYGTMMILSIPDRNIDQQHWLTSWNIIDLSVVYPNARNMLIFAVNNLGEYFGIDQDDHVVSVSTDTCSWASCGSFEQWLNDTLSNVFSYDTTHLS